MADEPRLRCHACGAVVMDAAAHQCLAQAEWVDYRIAIEVCVALPGGMDDDALFRAKEKVRERLADAVHNEFPVHEHIEMLRPLAVEGWT